MQTSDITSAIELIRNPERMNRSTVDLLLRAIEIYPYHQALYLLLLQNLYKTHDPRFGQMLKKYAVMVADRGVLFDLVEGSNYVIAGQPIDDDEQGSGDKDGDRTLDLIDSFLHSLPDSPKNPGRSGGGDPSADYSAYLEQLPDYHEDDANAQQPAPHTDVQQYAKSQDNEFTVEGIRHSLHNSNTAGIEEEAEPLPEESAPSLPESDYFTETMAGIYIKQQKYSQALEIIRVLSADNPKKSVYFADQIRYLELLIKLQHTKEQK